MLPEVSLDCSSRTNEPPQQVCRTLRERCREPTRRRDETQYAAQTGVLERGATQSVTVSEGSKRLLSERGVTEARRHELEDQRHAGDFPAHVELHAGQRGPLIQEFAKSVAPSQQDEPLIRDAPVSKTFPAMCPSLRGISSMATSAVLAELARAWNRQGNDVVHFESVGGVDAARRVEAGEVFDIVVLASDALDRLGACGTVLASTKRDIVRSVVAVAVPAGASRPEIGTESQLQAAVLRAASIGFSTGPSGSALLRLFERWGLADALRGRLLQAPPGTPVGQLLADGRVELGFQQLSELWNVSGVEVLGFMPPGLEIITTFSAAQCSSSSESRRVRDLLDFLAGAATGEIKRRHRMLAA